MKQATVSLAEVKDKLEKPIICQSSMCTHILYFITQEQPFHIYNQENTLCLHSSKTMDFCSTLGGSCFICMSRDRNLCRRCAWDVRCESEWLFMSSHHTASTPRLGVCAKKRARQRKSVVSLLQIRTANNTPVAKLLAAVYLGPERERESESGKSIPPENALRMSQREIYCLFCLD